MNFVSPRRVPWILCSCCSWFLVCFGVSCCLSILSSNLVLFHVMGFLRRYILKEESSRMQTEIRIKNCLGCRMFIMVWSSAFIQHSSWNSLETEWANIYICFSSRSLSCNLNSASALDVGIPVGISFSGTARLKIKNLINYTTSEVWFKSNPKYDILDRICVVRISFRL